MKKTRLLVTVVLSCLLIALMTFAASADSASGHWVPLDDGRWTFMDGDGNLVKNEVGYWIGEQCFGFDSEGIMYTGWVQPYKTSLNYSKETRESWYFFKPNGAAPDYGYDAETGYLFWSDGEVRRNGWVYSGDSIYVSDASGVATEVYPTEWQFVNGEWYYVSLEGEFYNAGIYTIGDTQYCFNDCGHMATNEFVECWDDYYGMWVDVYADANGQPIYAGWILHDGHYYYISNGERCYGGIYEIEGVEYYFDWQGILAQNCYVYDGERYAGEGGALLRDTWCLNPDGEYEYYNASGYRINSGLYEISGVQYYFNNGVLVTNEIRYLYNNGDYAYHLVGDNGAITKVQDGWITDPGYGNQWMYFEDGDPIYGEIRNIGGVDYAFNDNGYLVNQDTYGHYNYEGKGYGYYSINANGTVNLTPGWDMASDCWVFIQSDGKLKQGWLNDGSGWYYLNPSMYKNAISTIGGRTYYFDANGRSTDVYANQNYKVSGGATYYYEYGSYITGWRQIAGDWYYFNPAMYTDGIYEIGGKHYYFDQNGVMLTGWIRTSEGDWCYAEASGELVTGIKTLGDVTYAFDSYGWLRTSTTVYQNGVEYLVNENGKVIADDDDASGWIFDVDTGKYHYLDDGYFYSGGTYYIDGVRYAFRNYTLVTNEVYNSRYYQAGGAMFDGGWFVYNGAYRYANEDGYLYEGGVYEIDGKYYCFRGYDMVVGTFIHGTDIVVTNESGAVVSVQSLNEGWNLVSEGGRGNYYYVENGEFYYGWKGNYYLAPAMVCDTTYEIDGAEYYFDKNGVCAINTWIDDGYGDWLYAKADGKLYRNEWANIGGNWYYFDYIYMVEDCTLYISEEGKYHNFAKGGAWLGEATSSLYADGWHFRDGKWQYCVYGDFITNGIRKIDGVWYGFDYEGMVTNDFNGSGYYMNGSGVVMNYTGWQMIQGKWYYFTNENKIATGWFTDGGVEYYGTFEGIATGYELVDGELCSFSAGGAYQGVVTADGWYLSGADYYYIRNGKVLRGEVAIIDGVRYAFDYDGVMITYGYYADAMGTYLFGANGAQITAEGWYLIGGEWLYVGADGYLCTGTHVIGGVSYYFDIWSYYYY